MEPRELRHQVEAIMADAESVQWDTSAKGGAEAAERLVEDRLAAMVKANVDAALLKAEASRPSRRPVTISLDLVPLPRDLEAERAVLAWLLILQPGPPSRCHRDTWYSPHWPGDHGVTPDTILAALEPAEFFDPFHRWLFEQMPAAMASDCWTTHLVHRREDAWRVGAKPLCVHLKRLCDGHAMWWWTKWHIERIHQAAARRAEITSHLDQVANIIQEQRNQA